MPARMPFAATSIALRAMVTSGDPLGLGSCPVLTHPPVVREGERMLESETTWGRSGGELVWAGRGVRESGVPAVEVVGELGC